MQAMEENEEQIICKTWYLVSLVNDFGIFKNSKMWVYLYICVIRFIFKVSHFYIREHGMVCSKAIGNMRSPIRELLKQLKSHMIAAQKKLEVMRKKSSWGYRLLSIEKFTTTVQN